MASEIIGGVPSLPVPRKTPKEIAAEALARMKAKVTPPPPNATLEEVKVPTPSLIPDMADPEPNPAPDVAGLLPSPDATRVRRELMARRFAAEYLANGWDPVLAYRAVVRLHGSRARYDRRGTSKLKPASRMVRRWLQYAIPYIRQMLAEERTRSAQVIQSAYSYLSLVMSTSPATFLRHEDDGKVEFDLGQPHITPAQRAMIVSLTVDPETQRIRQIRTPDPTKAVDQVIKLMELERHTKGGEGSESIAREIAERYRRARLVNEAPAEPLRPAAGNEWQRRKPEKPSP